MITETLDRNATELDQLRQDVEQAQARFEDLDAAHAEAKQELRVMRGRLRAKEMETSFAEQKATNERNPHDPIVDRFVHEAERKIANLRDHMIPIDESWLKTFANFPEQIATERRVHAQRLRAMEAKIERIEQAIQDAQQLRHEWTGPRPRLTEEHVRQQIDVLEVRIR